MAKHVYPPWYKSTQRGLFVLAAVLVITFPTLYGRRRISVTALVGVLGVFFGFWIAFSLGIRYLLPSYTPESTLPIHIHAPLPPIVLHSPKPDAVPAAPAIRIHSAYDNNNNSNNGNGNGQANGRSGRARFGDHQDNSDEDDKTGLVNEDGGQHLEAPPSHSRTRSNDGNENNRAGGGRGGASPANGNNVKFQTRARGYTADSTNSEVYPTYASYRQAQHTSFDAFAQRIRRAFNAAAETAASSNTTNQNNPNNKNQEQQGDQVGLPDLQQPDGVEEDTAATGANSSGSAAINKGLLSVENNGSVHSSNVRGRPRSTSAASMISNLSEKIKLGNLFGRSSTSSRRGSDASSFVSPTAVGGSTIVTPPTIVTTQPEGDGEGGAAAGAAKEQETASLDVPSSRRQSVSIDLTPTDNTTTMDAGSSPAKISWGESAVTRPTSHADHDASTAASASSSSAQLLDARRLSLSTNAPREPSPLAVAGNVIVHPRLISTSSVSTDPDVDEGEETDDKALLDEKNGPKHEQQQQPGEHRAAPSTTDDRPVDLAGLKTSREE